jgi:hypothetical protein
MYDLFPVGIAKEVLVRTTTLSMTRLSTDSPERLQSFVVEIGWIPDRALKRMCYNINKNNMLTQMMESAKEDSDHNVPAVVCRGHDVDDGSDRRDGIVPMRWSFSDTNHDGIGFA